MCKYANAVTTYANEEQVSWQKTVDSQQVNRKSVVFTSSYSLSKAGKSVFITMPSI